MSSLRRSVLALLFVSLCSVRAADYFPPPGTWSTSNPQEVGLDAAKLQQAIAYSVANETAGSKGRRRGIDEDVWRARTELQILGPRKRARAQRHRDSSWLCCGGVGDVNRTDMTHSVTKTFLTTVVGLAWQRGLIRDLGDHPADYLPTNEREQLFSGEHNAKITWEHLLRQPSDWSARSGACPIGGRPVGATPADYSNRAMHEPGTFFNTTTSA